MYEEEREGGRVGMSGQVSRFYALRKSIEPEGVDLNHTLRLLILTRARTCTRTYTRTRAHTQNPEPGLATLLVPVQERHWKKL